MTITQAMRCYGQTRFGSSVKFLEEGVGNVTITYLLGHVLEVRFQGFVELR